MGPQALLAFAGFVLASAIPFVFGIPYMAFILNVVGGGSFGVGEILQFGLWPFVVGGLVKAAIAAVAIPAAWAAVRAVDTRKNA
jgi:biotin transport system substrate-specific component